MSQSERVNPRRPWKIKACGDFLIRELKKHLLMIQEQAEQRFDSLVEQMAEEEVTEQLKAQDQLLWVQRMNSIIICKFYGYSSAQDFAFTAKSV